MDLGDNSPLQGENRRIVVLIGKDRGKKRKMGVKSRTDGRDQYTQSSGRRPGRRVSRGGGKGGGKKEMTSVWRKGKKKRKTQAWGCS